MNLALDDVAGAVDEIIKELRAKVKDASKHAGVFESLRQFFAAVDWKEPWLVALLAFHVLLLLSVIVFRKSWNFNVFILLAAAATVYNAQQLNQFLGQHWKSFAGQPYFDEQGIFISAVMSAPLLLIMFIQLVIHLGMSSSLLVDMKRKELRYEARQRAKQEAAESKKTS